jgi:hypothetical protein
VNRFEFEDLECAGGTVAAFNGWAPHRSAANTSPFPPRAIFVTYNPKSEDEMVRNHLWDWPIDNSAWKTRKWNWG